MSEEPETPGHRLARQIGEMMDLKILQLRARLAHDSIKMLQREGEAKMMAAAIAETINVSLLGAAQSAQETK